jgi:hypothetical protein
MKTVRGFSWKCDERKAKAIACLLLHKDYEWVSLGNTTKAKLGSSEISYLITSIGNGYFKKKQSGLYKYQID